MFIFIALFTILVIFLFFYETKQERILKQFPGPKPLPLLGNALDFSDSTSFLPVIGKFIKQYGKTIKMRLGPRRMFVVTADDKLFELILSSSKTIEKSLEYRFFHPWLGTGLLTSGGLKWKKRRRMLTPAFHFGILEKFIGSFESCGKTLIGKLSKEVDKPSVNIFQYVTLCALDVICESSMGTKVQAQEKSDASYVRSVIDIGRMIMARSFSFIKMYDFLYPLTKDYYVYKNALNILHPYTISVIKKRQEDKLSQENSSDYDQDGNDFGTKKKNAFLDLLLESKIDGKPLTIDDIREEVDTFMFEGHDTTSSAISFTLYLLAHHPDIQRKALSEQQEIFGNDFERDVTHTDLQNMKYLELVLKESMRLYPPVPLIGREVTEDIEFDGKIIPKGSSITLAIYIIHRHPDYFPEPEKFKPERFESGRENPYSYVPFSAGPRNCIGQKFAMLELKSTVSMILRNFELLPAVPDEPPKLAAETILKSVNGIKISIKKRKL